MGLSEDDIRLATSWRGHRKRKKLKRILGADGVLALLDLWLGAAIARPNGVLHGWSAEDVALEADWEGDPDDFIAGLKEAGFLEQDEHGVFILHDWQEYQGWVMGKEARVAKAKKGADARWGKKSQPEQCPADAPSMPVACPEHARSNAPLLSTPLHSERQSYTPPLVLDTPAQGRVELQTGEPGGGVSNSDFEANPEGIETQPHGVSMELQQVAEGYPGHCDLGKAETAMKALAKLRQWPGMLPVQADILRREQCDRWTRGFVPDLSNYISARMWLDPIPEARAAPPGSAYASAESKAIDDIANELRKGRAQNELHATHTGQCPGGPPTAGPALSPVQTGERARPPG